MELKRAPRKEIISKTFKISLAAAFVIGSTLFATKALSEEIMSSSRPAVSSSTTTRVKKHSKRIPILMYHNVGKTNSRFSISTENFLKQIEYLKKEGFHFATLDEITAYSFPEKSVLLTFDDVTERFYFNAYPVLKEYVVSATIFPIVSEVIGEKKIKWWQLENLQKSGLVAVQSHSFSHSMRISKWSKEAISQDIGFSRFLLEYRLKNKVNCLAWPGGIYDKNSVDIAKEFGFEITMGCGGRICDVSDIESGKPLPRIEVNGNWSTENLSKALGYHENKPEKKAR